MKKMYLQAGKITTTHGIKGDVRVMVLCDSPELFCEFDSFYTDDKGRNTIEVEKARVQKNIVVAKFAGIESIEMAQAIRNTTLYIHRDDLSLDSDTYYIEDIIGCTVVNFDDESIVYGKIVDVTQTGAHDVYHIKNSKGKLLLAPAIEQVVKHTDIDSEIIKIIPLEGLFDED